MDPAGHKLLVTNTLTDTAGNKLVLTLIEQRDDHKSLVLEVQSVQYNDGAVITRRGTGSSTNGTRTQTVPSRR